MKNLVIILILFNNCFAQQEDPIQNLYSQDEYIVIEAINKIIDDSLYNAIPDIINLIEDKSPLIQLDFLRALSFFHHESAISQAKRIIEQADQIFAPEINYNPDLARVLATSVLFKFNDYSSVNYIFEAIDRRKPNILKEAIVLLPFIYQHIPEFSERSISELFYAYKNSFNDKSLKYFVFSELAELNFNSFNKEVINQLLTNDYFQIRYKAFEILNENNYEHLDSLLKIIVQDESESPLRVYAADSLLKKYGKPSDVYFIRNHIRAEIDSVAASLMSYSLKNFIPPRPTISTAEMINNLINYNTEMYGYGWIKEANLYGLFDGSLNKIKEYYRRPDLENLCREIFMLNDRIETSRNEDRITTEAYKFLHYHLQYIKENVEKELGNCQQ